MSVRAIVGLLLCSTLARAGASGGITELDPAGEPLAAFPHFERVRSFDPSMAVTIAVDPSLHPALAGQSCAAYVVADRTAAQWQTDASLLDLSAAVETLLFPGGSIQANRFVVAAAGELDAEVAMGLGVGYDVVLDCNRNGTLDAGDFADGAGDEAGIYAVVDTTLPGPLATAELLYGSGTTAQVVYYPQAIATLGQLPLVVVSHGWTHDYRWYGHIGRHLASYGYIVMSHVNDVGNGGPGATETASTATLANLDHFLNIAAALPVAGHVDSHRIVLIGHSTGGEGVVRAYTRLRKGEVTPVHFTASDVVLLAPIAPVAWLDAAAVDPFDVPFHMFAGAADTDTSNAPFDGYEQLLVIYERARGPRQLTYVQGAGHADFHDGTQASEDWATGPDLIGRTKNHAVVRGYLLPLLELYVRGNPAARDFFARMDGSFRPPGIHPGVVLAREARDAQASSTHFVIDDYQTQTAAGTSSSGAAVTSTVAHLAEVPMRDVDGSFQWSGSQPSNGMTRARSGADGARCAVFDWSPGSPVSYELAVVPTQRDRSGGGVISFRAAQGTRHSETVALNAPLTFTVTLRDGSGNSSSIGVGNYGTITRPYQRTGSGAGAGWANEFSTVRIRLADFATNGGPLDLGDIAAVRFDFGGSFGSPRGRLALDDVELTNLPAAAPFLVRLERAGAATRLGWPAQNDALAFNVYRGTIPPGGFASRGTGYAAYDHVCFEAGDGAGDGPLASIDADALPPGAAGAYYLVASVTAAGEGSLGDASIDLDPLQPGEQRERPNAAPCP